MAELIRKLSTLVRTRDNQRFVTRVYGEGRSDGTWEGWLEFDPLNDGGRRLRTERETTQPNRGAVAYWAEGLEPVYVEGAFERALLIDRRSV